MLKVKTVQSFKKRFRKTASGKFKHKHAYLRHILVKKSKKQKRRLRHKSTVAAEHTTLIKKSLPYS